MGGRRCVCGWCPVELPDDMAEWASHALVEHGYAGHSVRFYPALSDADELAALLGPGAVR